MVDIINPAVYRKHPNDIECVQVAEAFDFCLGSAIKHIWKAQFGNESEKLSNLKKAQFYIIREMERMTCANGRVKDVSDELLEKLFIELKAKEKDNTPTE